MVLVAVCFIFFLYSGILSGKFADWMIGVYQNLFRLDYDAAYILYQNTFRNHMDIIMIAAIACIFFIVFRIYLNWFTVYFEEIGKGMDSLLQEKSEDISLTPELFVLERRLNTVKHTIEKQKSDILTTEKRKNDLIMYLAHDLKTPLASVIGYLNLLRDEKEISDEVRDKYLSISLEKAERLEELINEFFEIARFNLSDITLQYSRISLMRLLEQVLYEFDPMLKEKGLTGKLQAQNDVTLRCDANKIQRVFDNLLRNAVMYSDEGGEIEITVQFDQAQAVTISVSNHGDTIPEEKLNRIFEQFYRLDDARSTKSGGAGLGLAIAKQIVELHGGSIEAQSREGQTRFSVTLPVSETVVRIN
ncbi:MAG: HAMP domain-containing histidine kinase [Lachnospiraceae bacterium]|nr:HAMP domain-containing histidine kinase [Lachnospiraceae bacterium]MDE7239680.1 HAMP domain-containing histidine kinase [Lachnospiraceae bacterium]